MKTKFWVPGCLIVFLALFFIINNFFWCKIDRTPAYNDQAHHLTNLHVWQNINQGLVANKDRVYYKGGYFYPPFYYACAAFLTYFFGESLFSCTLVNILFYVVLLVSVYAIGRKIFGFREGLTACLLLSLYPYIYGGARVFIIDFAVGALSALTVCLLLYSQGLNHAFFTVAAAFTCFLGMLTKQSFFIYIIGPLLATIFRPVEKPVSRRGILILAGLGLVLSVLFYRFFLFSETVYLYKRHFMDASLYSPADYWKSSLYYILLLPDQINWLSLLVFFPGFIGYLYSGHKNKFLILAWLLIPVLILSFAPLKDSKYSMSILPAIALISAWGVFRLKYSWLRYLILGAVISFGFILHYLLFFNVIVRSNVWAKGKVVKLSLTPYAEYTHKTQKNPFDDVQLKVFEILNNNSDFKRENTVGITDYSLSMDSLMPWFIASREKFPNSFIIVNEWGMKSFVMQHKLPYRIYPLSVVLKDLIAQKWSRRTPLYDFFVTIKPLSENFYFLEPYYKLCGNILIPPDNSWIYCYVKRKDVPLIFFEDMRERFCLGIESSPGITGDFRSKDQVLP